jgi:hypothetical protein
MDVDWSAAKVDEDPIDLSDWGQKNPWNRLFRVRMNLKNPANTGKSNIPYIKNNIKNESDETMPSCRSHFA